MANGKPFAIMNWSSRIMILFIICILLIDGNHAAGINIQKSTVYGPGLTAGAALPARYFFIQARDNKGRK